MSDYLNFIMEKGNHEIFSMFGYKVKLGNFQGPHVWCGNKSLVIYNYNSGVRPSVRLDSSEF
jgi:hypothetical protein